MLREQLLEVLKELKLHGMKNALDEVLVNKPTARAKAKQVMKMLDNGYKKTQIAEELNIGLASVYRIIADQQESV